MLRRHQVFVHKETKGAWLCSRCPKSALPLKTLMIKEKHLLSKKRIENCPQFKFFVTAKRSQSALQPNRGCVILSLVGCDNRIITNKCQS